MKKVNTMKWLSFFLMAILSVGLMACSSDDDDVEAGKISIVGTWTDGPYTTVTFGSNGDYKSVNTSVPDIPQYRTGTYSYNASQSLLTVNVKAVANQNGAYQRTYIVQTLTESTLVLLHTDGEVEGYYTRKY